MRVDKGKLEALASLNDEALWQQIKAIVAGRGIRLPDAPPPHSELEKFRGLCRAERTISFTDAIRLINNYKKGKSE